MMTVVVVLVAVAMVAVVAYGVGKASNAPKRFGLKEAEAAASYLGSDASAAKPVMSVVCGVLGYENKVAEDVEKFAAEKDAENAKRGEEMEANKVEIERLEAEIEKVKAANVTLVVQSQVAVNRVNGARLVAKLFQS